MLRFIPTTKDKSIQINPAHIASVISGYSTVTLHLANGQQFEIFRKDWERSDLRQDVSGY
jgi:hypothetical protein